MPEAQQPLSIGVIDPDASSRRALARLLLACGYPSTPFAKLAEYDAHQAGATPADLVFIDAAQWLDAAAVVRGRVFGDSTVVALGTHAAIDQVGRSFSAGCFDFLVKPLAPALLLGILAEMAGRTDGAAA